MSSNAIEVGAVSAKPAAADAPICTKVNRAPRAQAWTNGCKHSKSWNREWNHADAYEIVINEDHDDRQTICPHCGQSYISEGIDS